jgi:hypothetical protein
MNKRILGVIIVIVALAIIAGIVYVIFFYKFSNSTDEPIVEQPVAGQQNTTLQPTSEQTNKATSTSQTVAQVKKAEIQADDLVRMASAFAERFGSFSNQSDYGNIRDLQIFMTEKMKEWAKNYINDARVKKTQTTIYYGIITKALSGQAKKFDSDIGQAEILVKTQRRESSGTSGNSLTFYQDILIKYIREQGVWRVDSVEWQAK